MAISIAFFSIVSACGTAQPMVVEKLDELTSVTITHSRTPLILSLDIPFDKSTVRDLVQLGAIEVNRMGTLQYYLWTGIWDIEYESRKDEHPEAYKSMVLVVDGDEIPLDLQGWTEQAIGLSEPVYKKIFDTAKDAYYPISLEQIGLLSRAESIRLRTGGADPKDFVLLYRQDSARNDLAEFLATVMK